MNTSIVLAIILGLIAAICGALLKNLPRKQIVREEGVSIYNECKGGWIPAWAWLNPLGKKIAVTWYVTGVSAIFLLLYGTR